MGKKTPKSPIVALTQTLTQISPETQTTFLSPLGVRGAVE